MDVREVIKRKHELEKTILNATIDFEDTTQCSVDNISLLSVQIEGDERTQAGFVNIRLVL